MSVQYAEFSRALPVKMLPMDGTNTIHLDQNWAKNRLLSFQANKVYHQRWQVGDETPLQLVSTILPDDLQVQNCRGEVLETIEWVEKLSGAGFKVYECTLNLDAIGNGKIVYLYQNVELMDTKFEFMSESISIRTRWPNTRVFEYYDNKNVHGVFYVTGVKFKFRIEAAPMDYDPQNESADFVDELHDTTLLSSTTFDKFTLYIGDGAGVADWALKLMNYIIHHRTWKLEDLQYAKLSGEKWETNRPNKAYPLYGGAIGITPANNLHVTQLNAETIEPGIVTGLVYQTGFFGESVTEITVQELTVNS